MKILIVETSTGRVLGIDDKIKTKVYPIVNDEEDKKNPILKEVIIKSFEPNDDGSSIRIIGDDGESYYDDNIIA